MTLRIAAWSGPRNISTAMMRAWESRPDCTVVDEPFYACYLHETGLGHPCRDAVLASQPTARKVVEAQLLAPVDAPFQYQKHMTHHMPLGVDLTWSVRFAHVFLIRRPEQVIASYQSKMPVVTAEDIGIVRQHSLFEEISAISGSRPVVIDGADILKSPETSLRQLCQVLGVPWIEGAMTRWSAGPRDSDGVWASHWYGSVHQSTGFAQVQNDYPDLSRANRALAEEMMPYYEALAQHRIK